MGEPLSGTSPPNGSPPEVRLDSWKEIAAYLGRDVTTVQRWEKRESMPVHRHLHDKRGSVYALAPELDAWLQSRRRHLAEEPEEPQERGEKEKEQKPEARVEEDADTDRGSRATRRARSWLILAGVGVLGLLAVAYVVSRGRTGTAAQPKIKSLAVLPL